MQTFKIENHGFCSIYSMANEPLSKLDMEFLQT